MYGYIFELQVLAVGTSERYTTCTAVSRARYNRAVNCIETFTFTILILYYPSTGMILEYYL